VNYQGRLSNPDGSPLATADYQLTFNIYDSATNSTGLVWGPQVFDGQIGQGHAARIPVVQGYFNVMLGPVDSNGASLANAFNATNRYVEITVSNRSPILPRQQILSAPYALQAGNAAKLAGYDWSAVFGINDPLNGRIAGTNLADGTVWPSKLAPRTGNQSAPLGGLAISTNVSLSPAYFANPASVPGLQVSLVTSGRPVMVFLTSGASEGEYSCFWTQASGGGASTYGAVLAYRGSTHIGTEQFTFYDGINAYAGFTMPTSMFRFLDFSPAGTNTYTIKLWSIGAGGDSRYQVGLSNVRLAAVEL